MASSSAYLPDYTSLWAQPQQPAFARPPSPPRRGTSSAHDARRSAHEQALRDVARARSVYHHALGDHLPARTPRETMASSGCTLSWKDRVKLHEAEAGYTWNGSAITEQEERELSDEEETRMVWRENVLSYGRSSLVVLGRGRTLQEEAQDREDREAMAGVAGPSNGSAIDAQGSPWNGMNGVDPAAPQGGVNRASNNVDRGAAAANGRGGRTGRRAGGGGGGGGAAAANNVSMPSGIEGERQPTRPGPANARNGDGADISLMAEDRDVYEGEYTLDDGDEADEEINDAGSGRRMAGREMDLDAGLESMD